MPQIDVNFMAVLVAAIVHVIVGSLWYSPVLFAKMWMKLVGTSEEKLKGTQAKAIAGAVVASLVMSYVLAHIVGYAQADTIMEGMKTGFWVWLGFVATSTISSVLFEQKRFMLYVLTNGYELVSLLIMGAVLASWN